MTTTDPTEIFRQEARELLDQLEQALLDLEQNPDDRELVDSAFRALHTLKGSGAMFGFDEVAEFVHEFETAFDQVRKGKSNMHSGLVVISLAAKDHIANLIAEPGRHAANGMPILRSLRESIAAGGAAPLAHHPQEISTGTERTSPSGMMSWRVRFHLSADALALGTNPLLLLDELRTLGECSISALTDQVPPIEDIDPETSYLGWDIVLTTQQPREVIEDVFIFLKDGMDLSIEPVQPIETTLTANEVHVLANAGRQAQVAPAGANPLRSTGNGEAAAAATAKAGSSLRVPA